MKIQTSFYMFLHGFCLRSGEEVYQAHQAGLTECLEFALQNDLIESGSRAVLFSWPPSAVRSAPALTKLRTWGCHVR